MVEITRHFGTVIYIVYKNKVLLHKHKKLDLILPLGGHIDRDELPHESAIKEVKEESGLDVELYDSSDKVTFSDNTKMINYGEGLHMHNINKFHQHMVFVYYAKAFGAVLKPDAGESKELNWYSKEEIEKSTYLLDNVKYFALKALEKLKE